jgi:hypothetical protein
MSCQPDPPDPDDPDELENPSQSCAQSLIAIALILFGAWTIITAVMALAAY